MLTREPALNQLVEYLEEEKRHLLANPDARHRLSFSAQQIEEARQAFSRMILGGEEHLHRLCNLLCSNLFVEGRYRLRSVVVGQPQGSSERFTLMQPITEPALYSQTDLDLGSRLLERLRVDIDGDWQRSDVVANFVEYQPIAHNRHGVYKVVSRVKAEEEIWNKVVDEIFDIDQLVEADKQLRKLSRFVKDVLGVKLVVGSEQDARDLQVVLESQAWLAGGTEQSEDRAAIPELSFFEVKDYLGTIRGKESGWRAIKSVARFDGHLFEIQIQPLRNYHSELERFTAESHEEFKAKRESLRLAVASQVPLFGFYRALLQWLFLESETPPPQFQSVEIELTE
jgi:hypothetical protein